jgi:ABC-2 type transport system ATP-binding protein
MDEAEKCFELAMMRDGEVIATGTPQEIKQKANVETIEEAFIYYGDSKEAGGILK